MKKALVNTRAVSYTHLVKISPSVIQHIKAPSKDIILAAIERDFSVIKTIPNPSEELQLIEMCIRDRCSSDNDKKK